MTTSPRVCVIAPYPPPYGGMGIQAEKLVAHLAAEGVSVGRYSTNSPVPSFLAGVKGVRTVFRLVTFVSGLLAEVRRSDVLHILSAADLSFWCYAAPTLILGKLYGRERGGP